MRITFVSAVAHGRVCERVAREKSSKRSRRTTVRPTRPARRIRPVTRSTRPTRIASTSSSTSAAVRARAASRSSHGGGRPAPAGDRGCGRARGAGGPKPGRASRPERPSAGCATSPTVLIPRPRSFAGWLTTRRPRDRSTGSGCRKSSSPSGGTTSSPSGLATPLATLARNFVLATPTVMRQADLLSHLAPQPHRDLGGRPCDPPHPADVEERLVDREALDERRGVLEDAEHRLARLGVNGHAGRDDDRVRAQPAGLVATHRRAHSVRLGLVARREDDARADDHRPPAQAGIVPLLDGRVERVDVRVKDRRFHANICSHTPYRLSSPGMELAAPPFALHADEGERLAVRGSRSCSGRRPRRAAAVSRSSRRYRLSSTRRSTCTPTRMSSSTCSKGSTCSRSVKRSSAPGREGSSSRRGGVPQPAASGAGRGTAADLTAPVGSRDSSASSRTRSARGRSAPEAYASASEKHGSPGSAPASSARARDGLRQWRPLDDDAHRECRDPPAVPANTTHPTASIALRRPERRASRSSPRRTAKPRRGRRRGCS